MDLNVLLKIASEPQLAKAQVSQVILNHVNYISASIGR